MTEDQERLGVAIDTVDNLAHALGIPMSAEIHVGALRRTLPEAVDALKWAFVAVVGENPWE